VSGAIAHPTQDAILHHAHPDVSLPTPAARIRIAPCATRHSPAVSRFTGCKLKSAASCALGTGIFQSTRPLLREHRCRAHEPSFFADPPLPPPLPRPSLQCTVLLQRAPTTLFSHERFSCIICKTSEGVGSHS